MNRIKLEPITRYQEMQCKLFSEFSYKSSIDEYSRRGQSNTDKIINDIYNGKVAEFMVYNFLVGKGKELSSPDLNIYKKSKKSFDADLYVEDVNIHVKSHKVNNSFPVSWLFQKTDPLVRFKKSSDVLALVVIDVKESYMYLSRAAKIYFDEPIKESLKPTKVCVYEKKILDL